MDALGAVHKLLVRSPKKNQIYDGLSLSQFPVPTHNVIRNCVAQEEMYV